MGSGDYPAGAANDPRAPYNEKSYGDCSGCGGTGEVCEECNEAGWHCDCEDEFIAKVCPDCEGTGDKTEQQFLDEKESWEEDTRER